jgi:hypothetical protein
MKVPAENCMDLSQTTAGKVQEKIGQVEEVLGK